MWPPQTGRSFRWRAALAPFLLVGGWEASAAHAELVLLTGGGILKVDEYHRQGDDLRLLLPSGGVLTLSVLRVERILEDEIVDRGPFRIRGAARNLKASYREGQEVPETPFGDLIFETARRHGVNPGLVAAMVWAESAFDPNAVSVKGASGLLQLMPATAVRFGLSHAEIFNPERNLDAGVRYISWLDQRFDGDLPRVLAGYNAGEATVDRFEGVPPYRETHDYIRRVYSAAGTPLQ